MSDELRVRFTYKPERGGYVCSEPGDMDGEYVKVPADDRETVSESWLREIGFAPIPGAPEHWTQLGVLLTRPEFIDSEGERHWDIKRGDYTVCITRELTPKTRGDVRRLCAALGITLRSNVWTSPSTSRLKTK
jgi:hypothetical protein